MKNDSGSLKQIDSPSFDRSRTRRRVLTERLFTVMQNAQHIHERWMARFLERRGWCVFYLDERARNCGEAGQNVCWLHLYESERKKKAQL